YCVKLQLDFLAIFSPTAGLCESGIVALRPASPREPTSLQRFTCRTPAHRSRLSVPAMKMRSSRPNPAGARYQRLPQSDDGFIVLVLLARPTVRGRIPYRAIGLATVLFLLGTALLTVGSLLLAGVYIDPQYSDRTWPVLLLGLLVFIPGGYHVFIAYNAWRGVKGYSFDDIPEYND
ncbi:PREDICTED: transmembrane protein 230-like, partial [Branchiostoma belcheri]|uniref:Transmembrane protein 230 n=1 Tax=Branchiostoma belcheri TaxID=7741 RepID=A0A6P4Z6Q9_BRABE